MMKNILNPLLMESACPERLSFLTCLTLLLLLLSPLALL